MKYFIKYYFPWIPNFENDTIRFEGDRSYSSRKAKFQHQTNDLNLFLESLFP